MLLSTDASGKGASLVAAVVQKEQDLQEQQKKQQHQKQALEAHRST